MSTRSPRPNYFAVFHPFISIFWLFTDFSARENLWLKFFLPFSSFKLLCFVFELKVFFFHNRKEWLKLFCKLLQIELFPCVHNQWAKVECVRSTSSPRPCSERILISIVNFNVSHVFVYEILFDMLFSLSLIKKKFLYSLTRQSLGGSAKII